MKKIFTLLLMAGLFSSCGSSTSSSSLSDSITVDTSAVIETDFSQAKEKPAENTSKWTYKEEEDKMTSKKKYFADIEANNELNFDFPYDGGSTGSIMIRKKNGETDVMLSISKGQFNTGVDGTSITVRFDDDKPVTFECSEASDNSSDLLFINNTKKFISRLKKSKKMNVQAEFYESGLQIMEFTTAGFVWAH
ncbi:hypothetical protein [Mucilaginibacter aquatilis]|uniref:Lipoprotein n=1 Tax=Mucilaginibacter aquatilis TaxID=1517760 RepID=A0A6I4I5H0_9SPHI|nr:hypothetical protein [Mucilaginibacter aquatilis]MVN90445.1 hypothetical protein [Mucilaginibacter aquatilis]